MQVVLILIMLGQVYMHFFSHQLMADSEIQVDDISMLNPYQALNKYIKDIRAKL